MAEQSERGWIGDAGDAERNARQAPNDAEIQKLLEGLRRSGLRLDREGRWWHEGEQVTHRRLARALSCWLDQGDDGRYILRLDADRYAYVEVEDAPFQVLTLESRGAAGALWLTLSDGSEEELAYATLREGEGGALYCLVKGRFPARLSRQAQQLISPHVAQDGEGFILHAAGAVWPIA